MSHLFALACLLSPLLLLTLRATYCSFLFLLLHFFCFEAPQRAQSTQPVFHATKLSSELESVREKTPVPSPALPPCLEVGVGIIASYIAVST